MKHAESFKDRTHPNKIRVTLSNFLASSVDLPRGGIHSLDKCPKKAPCFKANCPKCYRRILKKIVRVIERWKLHEQQWHSVHVSCIGQKREPNDYTSYDWSAANCLKFRIIQKLKRRAEKDGVDNSLLIFGGLESQYVCVDNSPRPRLLHAHMIVSGLPKNAILEELKFLRADEFNLNRAMCPITVSKVEAKKGETSIEALESAIAYVFSPPMARIDRPNESNVGKRQNLPTAKQMHELASNFGCAKCTDRLILCGFRFVFGKWQLTKLKSKLEA